MYVTNSTGRSPAAAAPMASPIVPASATGVSRTRRAPKRAAMPTVSLYEPPKAPMSCPSRITRGSRVISSTRARLIASRKNTFLAMVFAPKKMVVGLGADVVQDLRGIGQGGGPGEAGRLPHLLGDVGVDRRGVDADAGREIGDRAAGAPALDLV